MRFNVTVMVCLFIALCFVTAGCSSKQDGQQYSQESSSYDIEPIEYDPLNLYAIEPESGKFNLDIMFEQGQEHPMLDDFELDTNLIDEYDVQYLSTENHHESIQLGPLSPSFINRDKITITYQKKTYKITEEATGNNTDFSIIVFSSIEGAQAYWHYIFINQRPSHPIVMHNGVGDVGTFFAGFVRSNVVVYPALYIPKSIDAQILHALYGSDLVHDDMASSVNAAQPDSEPSPPDVDVLFDHVFSDILQYENVKVTFTSDYAAVKESKYAFLLGSEHLIVDLQEGIKIDNGNGLGGRVATYSLADDTLYTGVFPYGDAVWLPNKVIAVVGGYQTSDYDSSEKVLLLDKYCEPLPNQLQFDYGISLADLDIEYGTHLSDVGDQYRIIGLVYHHGLSQYIAVYHTNAFWNTQDGQADNNVCTVGIAIFDDSGLQLERKDLDGVVYPHIGKRERLNIPQAFLISDTEILLITSGSEVDMLCIDFQNGTASTWTDEDMLAFLEESSQFVGEQNPSGSWQLSESRPEAPFSIDSKGLLHIDAIDTPAFAVPEKYSLLEWGMEESGAYFAIFRTKTD